VFVSTRGGGTADLWTLDLSTRRAKALTSGSGGDFRPSWSPDGHWIAFSSDRDSAAPFAHGRWERLQLTSLYIVRRDGSGLRRITERGDFCGSPQWMTDSRHVVGYCMTAEQTLANRRPSPAPGNDTRLVSIDVTTGASADLTAGAGAKMNPSPLPGNELGWVRKDAAGTGAGIYYASGTRGPRGDVRTASWSPDGRQVVFHKRLASPMSPFVKTFSRNSRYDLSLTGAFQPSFSPSGDRFVTNSRPTPVPLGATLQVTTAETAGSQVIYEDKSRNVLAPQWSPRGDTIIFSVGSFNAFFNGFHGLFVKPEDRAEGGAQVALINPDGTGFREVTSGPNNNAFPSLAPDGNRFVYRTFGPEGNGLRIGDLTTKAVTRVTDAYVIFRCGRREAI
jgi:TolB protein